MCPACREVVLQGLIAKAERLNGKKLGQLLCKNYTGTAGGKIFCGIIIKNSALTL